MTEILILILLLYFYFLIKSLRKYLVLINFKLDFWKFFFLNLVINLLNIFVMNLTYITYIICFLFLHEIASIFFRKFLLIFFYKFYYSFFSNYFFMIYDFSKFEIIRKKQLVILCFFILMVFYNYIIIYIIYLFMISMFNFNLNDKQYDEAILNKCENSKIRLFFRGKRKISKYKKFLLDPKKYKFPPKLILGKDFKFCRVQDTKMYLNNSL